ncbi:MAG: GAF domain-containing sensor histidine kinase [Chloroflexi bacterium]|nr:GAF domain-containing sensor histidine kinase [Chloroflexota bacterium]
MTQRHTQPSLRRIADIVHWPRLIRHRKLLSEQIGHLRWQVPLAALLLVLAHQTIEHVWFAQAESLNITSEIVVYGLGGPLALWLALGWIKRKIALNEAAGVDLAQAHDQLTGLNQRVSFLLGVSQRLGEAANEEELASLLLRLPEEIAPSVIGCSLIRFDDHHQPMPVVYHGKVDEAALVEWHRHLSSRAIRRRCESCGVRSPQIMRNKACPLLSHTPAPAVGGVACFSLERNSREFGILGVFLAEGVALTEDEQTLLEAVINETSLAFENTRLRTRELTTLYEINESLQLRLGFDGLMSRILARTLEASRADAGLMMLQNADGSLDTCATAGDWNSIGHMPLIESLAAGALRQANGEPIVATLSPRGIPESKAEAASVLCAPMMADEGPLGVIVLGSQRHDAFVQAQVRFVSAIAAEAALLAHNVRLYAQLEHQAILAERGRLAREMHDGLAQTLGFIKMRAGQIAHWIEAGHSERSVGAMRDLAQNANDAYLDLRATLDGLRLSLDTHHNGDFAAQLQRCAADFEQQTGLAVSLALDTQAAPLLSVSAQSHLLRIVQETLANIRKHANASRIAIRLTVENNRACLRIEDDGQGFDAGQDMPDTRHGLRLMRERTDLLGADLQITSAPGEGTRVCVEWPV